MDPNAALATLRDLAHEVDNGSPAGHRASAEDFAESFQALDKWLSQGGFLPAVWQRKQDSMDLLRRALPMLSRLGDFIGNGDIDPNRADSIGARCDLIRDIKAKLGEVPERHCLWCKKDLTDIMGVYVFVDGKPVDALLCVEHGANGANMISQNQYDYWTKRAAYLAGEDLG